MIIYFVFFVFILLFILYPKLQKNEVACAILFIGLGIFLCTCYMVGSDWRNYECLYYTGRNSHGDTIKMEIGYKLITKALSFLNVDFWYFFIIVKVLCYYTIIKFIIKYTKGNFAWALLYFYSYLALYYFIDCPFRNLIAASIFLYAIDSLLRNQIKMFVVFTLLASLFHMSVLFFAPLFFWIASKSEAINKLYFLFLCIAIYVLFAFIIQIGELYTIQMFLEMTIGGAKNLDYLFQMGNTFSIGMIAISVFYLFIIFKTDLTKLSTKESKIYNTSILYYGFYIAMYFIPMMNRFSLYGFLPFICTMSLGINKQVHKKNRVTIFVVLIFVVFLGNSLRNVTSKDYRFIPYSSYLEYLGEEKPSFNQRSMYNFVNSPYRNKEDKAAEYRY